MASTTGKTRPIRLARFSLSRLPSRPTLARLWNARQSARQQRPPDAAWVEGDLLWAKMAGYPTWPGMVTRDPFTNQFARQATGTDGCHAYSYHIQFFGIGGERSWVKDESLMDFKGRQAFIEEARKTPYKYKVTATWIQRLNFAIAQADKALPLSRNGRKRRFGLKYVYGPSERSLQRVIDNHFRYKP